MRVAACTAVAVAAGGVVGFAPISAGARGASDPGRLPQTTARPSSATPRFRSRMVALWRGITRDDPAAALPAFFPRSAYLQVKAIAGASADYRDRLLRNFRLDIHAAHALLGRDAAAARFVGVRVPAQWAWIVPGYCANRTGYWHAPGSRLVYREGGLTRSFGIFSLISWRGEWYVVHLARWDEPGTVDAPASGVGAFGPPGGC